MRNILVCSLLLAGCGVKTVEIDGDPAGSTNPIVSDALVWTWVPFADAVCGNGKTTGLGVNASESSNTLVLYLQGGGACWDGTSCLGPFSSAVGIQGGYRYGEFQREENLWGILPLERGNGDNPFQDANLAFVPYCTGDVHVGTNVASYHFLGTDHDVHHVGANNLDAYLKRLAPTFPNVTRVVLSGASAGGFGAMANLERVQLAFPSARVDVLDDSGPLLRPTEKRLQEWTDAWHTSLPQGCADCSQGPEALRHYLLTEYPETRLALSVYQRDHVLVEYTGLTGDQFSSSIDALRTELEALPHARMFTAQGSLHVVLAFPDTKVRGVVFKEWLRQFANDAPEWSSVTP